MGGKFRIDAILCVVDAKHIQQHLDEVREEGVINEAVNQVCEPSPQIVLLDGRLPCKSDGRLSSEQFS